MESVQETEFKHYLRDISLFRAATGYSGPMTPGMLDVAHELGHKIVHGMTVPEMEDFILRQSYLAEAFRRRATESSGPTSTHEAHKRTPSKPKKNQ
nr:MAG: hypothetical protein DIU57_14305 [Pseudomonadota bacterium]